MSALPLILAVGSWALAIVTVSLAMLFRSRARWYSRQARDLAELQRRLDHGEIGLSDATRQFRQIQARRIGWWPR